MTPPGPKHPRIQSQTDRDIGGFAALKERNELAIPHEVTPEKTNVGEAPSPELLKVRERRTTDEKIDRALDYAREAERYRYEREVREAAERKAERRARFIVGVIAAVGTAVAAIVAAVH